MSERDHPVDDGGPGAPAEVGTTDLGEASTPLPAPGEPTSPAGPPGSRPERSAISHPEFDPVEDRRAERRVAATFLVSAAATVGFIIAYVVLKLHTPTYGGLLNYALGGTLALAMFALGAGQILWAKTLIPHENAVQDRHDGPSSPEAREALEADFLAGAERLGAGRRTMLRRSVLLAGGLLPLPALVLLRDLGPSPGTQLRQTAWSKGKRLVDVVSKLPVKIGDLQVGAIMTVMPEGYESLPEEVWATSPTVLIRLRPGANHPLAGRANWAVGDHVAYSKICTHAGCPTSLFQQQTNDLLCPCHQSTFKVTEGCKVIFGPAARPLPQLPIALDAQGYFIAQSGYHEPVGPSFWERG